MGAEQTFATEWSHSWGVHNFRVNEEDSNTWGANCGFYGKDVTESGTNIQGSIEILFDWDRDNLDPDHLPIWFKGDLEVDGTISTLSPELAFNWLVDVKVKQNTVSSVEQDIKLFSGAGVSYNNSTFQVGLNGYLGFFFLEIDDDIPLTLGYVRKDLDHGTSDAYSVKVDTSITLGKSLTLYAQAQNWSEYGVESGWLENQLIVKLGYDSGSWFKKSQLFIKVEHTEYNLHPYNLPGIEQVLPWNDDTLIQAYIILR